MQAVLSIRRSLLGRHGRHRTLFTNGDRLKRNDPFAILGLQYVGDGAFLSMSDIHQAFREKAQIYHPDKQGGNKQDFQALLQAYQTLLRYRRQGRGSSTMDMDIEDWQAYVWHQGDRIASDRTDVAGVQRKRPAPPAFGTTTKYYTLGNVSSSSRKGGEYLTAGIKDHHSQGTGNSSRRRPSSVGRGQSKWVASTNPKPYVEYQDETNDTR